MSHTESYKRVLVTGASRGIGRATALRLAQSGFHLTLHCKSNFDKIEELANEISAFSDAPQPALLQFDISDRVETERQLLTQVENEGGYYGIVCNAGVTADNIFPAMKPEQWDEVIRTNLDGFYNVVHPLTMPLIQGRQGGRIVALSSISGIAGNKGQVNYSASKAGLIGATKALAQELAKRKITVNCVAPGLIETDMTAALPTKDILEYIPMRRLGKPEEIAATVDFLFSEEAAYITGQVISVNGGMV